MTKKIAGVFLAVMTTLLALVVLWQLRVVIIYVMIALTLAAAMRPLISRLVGRRFLVRLAWIFLYLVTLGCFIFLIYQAGRLAITEGQFLVRSVSIKDVWTLPVWLEGSQFQQVLVSRLPPPSKLFAAFSGEQGQFVLPAIFGFLQGLGGIITGVVVILFLSIYWSTSQIHFERLWLSLLPSDLRTQARDIWRTVEPDIGAYIRSQVILSLLVGLLLVLGYWLLGSPYPVLLALSGTLACLIPVVGTVLAVIPVLVVGLLTSTQIVLFTGLYTFLVLIVLIVWVKPRLFNRRWDNPILTIILLIALADAFGIVGIIIAPPISVVIQILWRRLVSHRLASGAAARVSDLKDRLNRLREVVGEMDEPHPPLVTSSMERLSLLLVDAEPILGTSLPPDPPDPP